MATDIVEQILSTPNWQTRFDHCLFFSLFGGEIRCHLHRKPTGDPHIYKVYNAASFAWTSGKQGVTN